MKIEKLTVFRFSVRCSSHPSTRQNLQEFSSSRIETDDSWARFSILMARKNGWLFEIPFAVSFLQALVRDSRFWIFRFEADEFSRQWESQSHEAEISDCKHRKKVKQILNMSDEMQEGLFIETDRMSELVNSHFRASVWSDQMWNRIEELFTPTQRPCPVPHWSYQCSFAIISAEKCEANGRKLLRLAMLAG